ncbi:MAG: hypothetical protein GY722_25175 [bacterium]|nr:hypothetical protein [bacterium]
MNRQLAGVLLDAGVDAGTEIRCEGDVAGLITSVAWSEGRSGHIGLAMVRVEVEPGTRVEIGHTSGRVSGLPMILLQSSNNTCRYC